MAVVTRRHSYEVNGEFLVYADITYDDAKQVIIDETVHIGACDLISVRVIGVYGTAFIDVRRGNSAVWQAREVPAGTDVTFNAGGRVRTVGDLAAFRVHGV